jgi:hypothetical protein
MFVYDSGMVSGGVGQLRAAVEVVGCVQREDLLGLWVEMARLDA